jgi:hypothetical protein
VVVVEDITKAAVVVQVDLELELVFLLPLAQLIR